MFLAVRIGLLRPAPFLLGNNHWFGQVWRLLPFLDDLAYGFFRQACIDMLVERPIVCRLRPVANRTVPELLVLGVWLLSLTFLAELLHLLHLFLLLLLRGRLEFGLRPDLPAVIVDVDIGIIAASLPLDAEEV